jgi:hypothetical protein
MAPYRAPRHLILIPQNNTEKLSKIRLNETMVCDMNRASRSLCITLMVYRDCKPIGVIHKKILVLLCDYRSKSEEMHEDAVPINA